MISPSDRLENRVQQIRILLFDQLSPDVAFGGGPRKAHCGDDDNHVWGSDTLVEVPTCVEWPCPTNDVLLESLFIYITNRFHKKDGGWTPRPNDYARAD